MVNELAGLTSNDSSSQITQLLEKPRTLLAVGVIDEDECYIDYLRRIGYIVEKQDGAKGIYDSILANIPDVLILDIDGLGDVAIQVAQNMKENPLTYTMPIIVVVGKRDLYKEIAALEAGAEDYVVKPFHPPLLAARIHTSIRRNIRLQISNPLTGLPGAIYVEEQTSKRMLNKNPLAMCYADLDHFKAFNDKYGYSRGDNVIRILATILNEGVSIYGNKGDFVGHIGGDDFVMIIDYQRIDEVCGYVTQCFDALIPFQYDEKDMERGYIESVNRLGRPQKFPIMTVSIGVVTNEMRELDNYLILTELAAEMKEYSKSISKSKKEPKSTYRVDKRTT